jgi:CheY-like chemotaxis protein
MDDEEAIRDVVLDILETEGFDAIAAADGHEAMNRYRLASDAGAPFDLIILDLTIPGGMGGLEVMRRLRKIDPEVRAIVSSGYSNDPVMADYEQHGFRGHIAKPYRVDNFLHGVRQALEGAGAHGA